MDIFFDFFGYFMPILSMVVGVASLTVLWREVPGESRNASKKMTILIGACIVVIGVTILLLNNSNLSKVTRENILKEVTLLGKAYIILPDDAKFHNQTVESDLSTETYINTEHASFFVRCYAIEEANVTNKAEMLELIEKYSTLESYASEKSWVDNRRDIDGKTYFSLLMLISPDDASKRALVTEFIVIDGYLVNVATLEKDIESALSEAKLIEAVRLRN